MDLCQPYAPFWGLGTEEGHQGWILSSCYLAQMVAATLSLQQESVSFKNTDHIQYMQRVRRWSIVCY